jgi:stage V sporulation protein B
MTKSKGNRQSFAAGAAVLTVAAVIVKIIGALYKIPLGNILGDEGMGHFGIAYSIYNMLLTISTAGFPVAMSKMISEANVAGRPNQIKRIFRVSMATFLTLGALGTGVMFFLNKQLAIVMKDILAAYSISALAPSVLFVCIMSAYRGYTQGHTNMVPSAISQVIEALCKLVIGTWLCWYLVKAGYGLEYGAAGAIVGVTIGTVLGAGYLFSNKVKVRYYGETDDSDDVPDSYSDTFKRLLKIGVPITIGSSVLSIITLIDTNLVTRRLQTAAGFPEKEAVSLFGAYYNTQTLFNLPSSFIPPITISVIPTITALVTQKNYGGSSRIAEASLRITTIFALPCGAGLMALSWPILNLLYGKQPDLVDTGAPLLAILGAASFFVCMVLITNALLQAYGHVYTPIKTMLIGGAFKIVINWILVGNPRINITGAPIGTLVCYMVIAFLNMVALYRYAPQRLNISRIFIKPMIASVIIGFFAWAAYGLLARFLGSPRLSVLIAIAAAAVLYLILVLLMRIITREDLEVIPKGEKIARILRLK